ncbi:U3 small nucleolar RNA-associated protein 10 [Pseudohyphozyma bogoriensis]|nr:U3 small nucleolar RNA-associated protein 10 [Pseudohyphozyma bogoriensis]
MSSSLASQLAQRTTLDSSRLASAQSLKHPPSFIYTPRHAAAISTAQLADIAATAWDSLASIDPFFERYQNHIFGEQARGTDRSALTKDENEKLDKVLEKVMRALGKHMLLKPAGVVLEWLVRRFRINDLNVAALLALFLPYHTTSHFPSALALVPAATLKESFPLLVHAQSSLQPLPLHSLLALLPPHNAHPTSSELLTLLLRLPLSYLENDENPHRALTSFWLQTIASYLEGASALPVGEQALVLSTILETLRLSRSHPDSLMASYILLARFSLHHPLEGDQLRVVLKAIVSGRASREIQDSETDEAFVTTLFVVSMLGKGDIEGREGKAFLGGSGWKALMKVENLGELLVKLCNQYNAERFMKPFLATLVAEASATPESLILLSSLLTPVVSEDDDEPLTLPASITSLTLTTVLLSLLAAENPSTSAKPFLPILSKIYQRYATVWDSATKALSASSNDQEKADLYQIVSLVLSGGSGIGSNLALSSISSDPTVRAMALKELLASEGLDSTFVRDTVLARIGEAETEILDVLFQKQAVAVWSQSVSGDETLAALKAVVAVNKSAEEPVFAYLFKNSPGGLQNVVEQVVWGRLLGVKGETEDRALAKKLKGTAVDAHSWLKGVSAKFASTAEANEAVVQALATNIASLEAEELGHAIEFLLNSSASSQDVHAALLSTLVLLALVSKIAAPLRLDLVSRILAALPAALDSLTSPQAESAPLLLATGLAPLLSTSVFSRPSSPRTLQRARAALLIAAVGAIAPPEGAEWSWLSSPKTDSADSTKYKALVGEVYKLAHTGSNAGSSQLAAWVLEKLFGAVLADDALAFLASVWTDKAVVVALRTIALRDGAAFVEALKDVKGDVDFQVVVPAVVVALGDKEKKVRTQAISFLEVLVKVAPKTSAPVYGKAVFYGVGHSSLKYLDVADVAKYTIKLLDSCVELAMDGSFLSTIHSTLLAAGEPEGKKKASLTFKAVVFLVSHLETWTDLHARGIILQALDGVKDGAKAAATVSLLQEAIKNREGDDEYVRLLTQPFIGASRKWIEAAENEALATIVSALEITDEAGAGSSLRKRALEATRVSLFGQVKGEGRLDLFKRLVRLATTSEARTAAEVLECLRAVKVDTETITSFLQEIRSSIASPVSKGAKRGRVSLGGASPRAERLPELVIALESVNFDFVTPSHTLVLGLFDLLSSLIEISTSAQVDIQYSGQLILATLSKIVGRVQPASGITNDSIRMAPVLDFMRASTNPQTSHQCLLLLAQLGPLVPDQLVHNVMPIFTFMGANVLQRDDAYSLRVVERTLASIIPSLVKSMKRTASGRDSLVSQLQDLMRVFTDAAAHVPRHRRVKLFVRFVETLGPREFLSAVAMLLLDGNADGEALPLSLFETFTVEIQLMALKQVIEEASRLAQRGDPGVEKSFLAESDDEEEGHERSVAILRFLTSTLESKQFGAKVDAGRAAELEDLDSSLTQIVRALLDLSSLSTDSDELVSVANDGVQAAVRLMSTQSFSEAILWLLEPSDVSVQSSALNLLRVRLPTIKVGRRADISPAVISVVEHIRVAIADPSADHDGVLATLEAIVASPHGEEDLVLSKTLPELLTLAGSSSTSKSARLTALDIVRQLTTRLGPRLIPLVAKIVPFSIALLGAEASHAATSSASLVSAAYSILEGLFTSIPTFIGAQLDKVFTAVLSPEFVGLSLYSASSGKARASLLSTAAKKIPAKTLYPAIVRLHAGLDLSRKEPLLGLLDLLNRALRQGKTADVAENYRPVFKLFLSVFDLRREHLDSISLDDVEDIEENALGAFVQFILKLNEQTFRPLFLRTYDWAVIDLAEESDAKITSPARRTVLYKLVDRLLVQLKSIFVPYYSFMLDQTIELFDAFAKGDLRDLNLWTAVSSALTKAIEYDESGFWTPVRLGKLSEVIANQLEAAHPPPSSLIASHYHPMVAVYAQALLPHENLLKTFNTSLLMLTRLDDLRVKRGALEALEQLWETLGDGMLGLVPETTPFLAETMEETEGQVEFVTRRLIKRIEEHLGESLQDYLE